MVKGIFKRGYSAVEEEKKKQEEERARRSSGLFRFFLKGDGDEGDIIFLTEEPVNFYEHNVKKFINGKERFDQVICIGEDCPLCAEGNRPTFKGAYLIVDRREFTYKDKNNVDVVSSDQIRLFVQGAKVLSQLERVSKKYSLANREMTMVRLGTGTSTTYTLEKGETLVLESNEIKELLPESLKEKYDGSMDSLYSIIEDSLVSSMAVETKQETTIDETISTGNEAPKKVSKLKLGSKKETSLKKYLNKN